MSSVWGNSAAGARTTPLLKGEDAAKFSGASAGTGGTGAASRARAADAPGGSNGNNSGSDAAISATDFLTLLVTEMQNQDPTADMDPNQYISQLTEINSLEQLISINQNLATVLGISSSSGSGQQDGGASSKAVQSSSGSQVQDGERGSSSAAKAIQSAALPDAQTGTPAIHGNLSVPNANPAAERVGRALSGHTSRSAEPAVRDIRTRSLP